MTAKPFTFEYDALTGISVADALREKAKKEREVAADYRALTGQLTYFYTEQARLADNRAKLLEEAAEKIHTPVHEELVRNFDAAFKRMGM